jgi:hypothetical protein
MSAKRLHVVCDSDCKAFYIPVTFDEYRQAYIHWKEHYSCGGCSHGC